MPPAHRSWPRESPRARRWSGRYAVVACDPKTCSRCDRRLPPTPPAVRSWGGRLPWRSMRTSSSPRIRTPSFHESGNRTSTSLRADRGRCGVSARLACSSGEGGPTLVVTLRAHSSWSMNEARRCRPRLRVHAAISGVVLEAIRAEARRPRRGPTDGVDRDPPRESAREVLDRNCGEQPHDAHTCRPPFRVRACRLTISASLIGRPGCQWDSSTMRRAVCASLRPRPKRRKPSPRAIRVSVDELERFHRYVERVADRATHPDVPSVKD